MSVCPLVDFDGDFGVYHSIDLPNDFLSNEVNPVIIQDVVQWQLAKRRSGTAHTKKVGDIAATTKKPWRQKGTGRARHGNLVAPQFRGGAVAFGPRNRDFTHSINKKVRRSALRMAITDKLLSDKLLVSRGKLVQEPKTGIFLKRSRAYLGDYQSLLYCITDHDNNLTLASRNVPNVSVLPVCGINVYDIVRCDRLVIDEVALLGIVERLK